MFNYYHDGPRRVPREAVALGASSTRRPGWTPDDIDVAMIYENFSPIVFLQLEALGLLRAGRGERLHRRRATSAAAASLPVNTNGGLLGEAYIHGVNNILEAVRQVRGTAVNQIDGASSTCSSAPAAADSSSATDQEVPNGQPIADLGRLARGDQPRTGARQPRAALPRAVRRGVAGVRRTDVGGSGPGEHRLDDPQPARRVHPGRVSRRGRTAEGHGHRRRRRRGDLLRGLRLPLHRRHARRRRAEHPRVQRRARRVRRQRPEAPGGQLPDPDRRHRRRSGRGPPRRRHWAAKSLQLPVFPTEIGMPDYFDEPLRPAVGGDPGDRAADLLPHRR